MKLIPQRFWINIWVATFIAFLWLLMQCKCRGNERILWALAQVESGDNPHAIGKAGEITRYQILPSTLRQMSRLRVQDWTRSLSCFGPDARSGASVQSKGGVDGDVLRYLGWLASKFTAATGRAPTPRELYLLWSCGYRKFRSSGFNFNSCSAIKRSAATRFENLYHHAK